MARAWFRSISDSGETYSLDRVIYRSATGSLLEVVQDESWLAETSAAEWKKLFLHRRQQRPASGVWSRREWVLPDIPDEHIITLSEGFTPLFSSPLLSRNFETDELYVKLCGNSHTGSFKDLGMTVLVSQLNHMIQSGIPVRAVACASTGDTSAALAAYAAKAGIPAVILLPKDKVSLAQLIQPVANGALVLALETDFDGCMNIVQQLTLDPSVYLANSMNSLRIEGQKTVGIETVEELDWQVPDWFIIPGGNLGNVSALISGLSQAHRLGLINKMPRVAVAQAAAANPFVRSFRTDFRDQVTMTAGDTLATAIRIGSPVSYSKAVTALSEVNGVAEDASEQELADASALADKAGLFTDPHTGVALAVLQKLRANGTIRNGKSVVVISTAHGLKFTDFKLGYHQGQLNGIHANWRQPPVTIPAEIQAVQDAVHRFADSAASGRGSHEG